MPFSPTDREHNSNQNTPGSKMKLEADMATLAADLDEVAREAGMTTERDCGLLEAQVKDAQATRLPLA